MQPIRRTDHWEAIRRHKLFVLLVLLLGPVVGHLVAADDGFLFGAIVSVVAVIWLWGEGHS